MTDDYYSDNDPIDDGVLDEIGEHLEEADDLWNKYAYLAVPKMSCPECGGTGQIAGGSLGSACPTCAGARVLDHPGAEKPDIPDFSGMRRALKNYSIALADQQLPAGHPGKRNLALPPASTLPRPEAIINAVRVIKEASKKLSAGTPALNLPEPKPNTAGALGDGSDFTDEQLDEIEDES